MASTPSSSSSSGEEAILVFHERKSTTDGKLKLLEQANCAKCWKPLYYNTKWPGSRESLRPPYFSKNIANQFKMAVAQCGHVFHVPCVTSETNCPLCFVLIMRLRPLHYKEEKEAKRSRPQEPNNHRAGLQSIDEMVGIVLDLQTKLDTLTSAYERITKKLNSSDKK